MPRLSVFNSPFLLGFDRLEQALEIAIKSAADGYPPYNVEQLEGGTVRITIAVAGFTRDMLNVTVENNHLVIRGKQNSAEGKEFLHRGIAARQFQRKFVLAYGLEIGQVQLENGLLHLEILSPSDANMIREIEIT